MLDFTIDDSLLFKEIQLKKSFSNKELYLYQYFFRKTKKYPENVIVRNGFVFFFVNNEDYFTAKTMIKSIRKDLRQKIVIVRNESNLVKLIFGFFPDLYIHDIKLELPRYKYFIQNRTTIGVYFLSYEDRGIAIGRKGNYIKAVNELFATNYIRLVDNKINVRIKCLFLN